MIHKTDISRWQIAQEQEMIYWSHFNTDSGFKIEFDRWRPFYEKYFKDKGLCAPCDSILEIGGSGYGWIVDIVSNKKTIIEPLHEKFSTSFHEGMLVFSKPAEDMEKYLEDATFDKIICMNCLDHTYDPIAIVKNCINRLTDNGLFFAHTDIVRTDLSSNDPSEIAHPIKIDSCNLLENLLQFSEIIYYEKVRSRAWEIGHREDAHAQWAINLILGKK